MIISVAQQLLVNSEFALFPSCCRLYCKQTLKCVKPSLVHVERLSNPPYCYASAWSIILNALFVRRTNNDSGHTSGSVTVANVTGEERGPAAVLLTLQYALVSDSYT